MSATQTPALESLEKQQDETAARFHQSWFPLALASELESGQVMGRDFLGTRVILCRVATGKAVVQSAFCPRVGADLSVGQVVDGQIRCAYHHWRFDCAGRCVDIPAGDKIPPGARIATYPSAEAWGLIWAFNGETPTFAVPGIPGAEERDLIYETHFRGTRPSDPWVSRSNRVGFQHLAPPPGLPVVDPDAVTVGEHSIEYRIESPVVVQEGRITGVNTFSQYLAVGDQHMFMLFSGAPIAHGHTLGFYVYGVRDTGQGREGAAERLSELGDFVRQLIAEDAPGLDTIRFRPPVLVASDRHLPRLLKYVREVPRALPLGPLRPMPTH